MTYESVHVGSMLGVESLCIISGALPKHCPSFSVWDPYIALPIDIGLQTASAIALGSPKLEA